MPHFNDYTWILVRSNDNFLNLKGKNDNTAKPVYLKTCQWFLTGGPYREVKTNINLLIKWSLCTGGPIRKVILNISCNDK